MYTQRTHTHTERERKRAGEYYFAYNSTSYLEPSLPVTSRTRTHVRISHATACVRKSVHAQCERERVPLLPQRSVDCILF